MMPMPIEVKASTLRPREANFYLTRNEWDSAKDSPAHTFHLWYLGQEPLLAIVSNTDIVPHVPENRGSGSWENTAVPFKAFISRFSRPEGLGLKEGT
jgi:hypothetical protein